MRREVNVVLDILRLVFTEGGGRMNWAEQECLDSGCKCEGCLELAHLKEEEE
jgi:hypothetical protein